MADETSLPDGRRIRLVIADVDGTLLTSDKALTEDAKAAVQTLGQAGVHFAITSSRPPRGMSMFVDPLRLNSPLAAFNGGVIANPDLSIIEQLVLDAATVRMALELIRRNGMDAWLYRGDHWLVTNANTAHVQQESRTVRFGPELVSDFECHLENVAKVVGVSDDCALVARCQEEAHAALDGRASASRSQPYYLDITNVEANKGRVVRYLSSWFHIASNEIATIGDLQNDVAMFQRSGLSIAMGNASDQVKAQADLATESNNDEGFAKAIERIILRRLG